MSRLKVLVFSYIDFSRLDGGALCSGNLLENMQRNADADLSIVTASRKAAQAANSEFASKWGIDHSFIQGLEAPKRIGSADSNPLREFVRDLSEAVLEKYFHSYERFVRNRRDIGQELREVVARRKPDLLLIDGVWSAMCAPAVFSLGIPCCFITHNHETAIHHDFRRHAQGAPVGRELRHRLTRWLMVHGNWIANLRFKKYVQRIYRQSAGIIALVPNDLPNDLQRDVKCIVLPPLLEEREPRWRHRGSRSVLFVGNASYFANRLAIEWLCERLAPELLKIDPGVRINVIGASSDEFPHWANRPNVNLLGAASREEVIRRIATEDLMISPTAQSYGAKLKLAECAAHGMPFMATESAMGGLPFLTFVPRIELENPRDAARLVLEYINHPAKLTRLSCHTTQQMMQARREQALLWAPFIRSVTSLKDLSVGTRTQAE